ncbi:hypothetical protein [Arcanobacterium phocae]|uniref:hypothetical protein n=1 Tax=Arcanobacterium phocae TaxID=131112 RepID=UPI001C0EA73A|nr:hypothetical protein [Arcanobacterium phocae]
MAHIIGWKIEGYSESRPTVDDESLAGGHSAGLWIYDRFSKTYISEWDRSSLLWELAFLNDPEVVAEQVEISLNVLKEREVSYLQVIEASLSVASRAEFSGIFGNKMLRGILADDVAEIIYEALVSHQYDLAVSLAKSMWEQEPDNGLLKSIYAFSVLPRDPNLAKELFQSEEVSKVLERDILKIDLACCHLAMNDVITAQQFLKGTSVSEGREIWGCFWLPESILKGKPQVAITSIAEWAILLDSLSF